MNNANIMTNFLMKLQAINTGILNFELSVPMRSFNNISLLRRNIDTRRTLEARTALDNRKWSIVLQKLTARVASAHDRNAVAKFLKVIRSQRRYNKTHLCFFPITAFSSPVSIVRSGAVNNFK